MRRTQEALAGDRLVESNHSCSPSSLDEYAATIKDANGKVWFGVGESLAPPGDIVLDLKSYQGVVRFEPADQVVVVRSGTTISALNQFLGEQGQCIPLGSAELGSQLVGGLLALNYPHTLEAQCGTWRDWVLGMTVVLADGTIARAGSMAVKNVAGYDVQKLFVGARDSLGLVAEVILKTFPAKALPQADLIFGAGTPTENTWIQRVLKTDFDAALSAVGDRLLLADRATGTLWCVNAPDLPRYEHDWVILVGDAERPAEYRNHTLLKFMRRTKDLFDPTYKLNPGVMGDF